MNNIYGKISKEFKQLFRHSFKGIADNISYQKGSSGNKHIYSKGMPDDHKGGKKVNLQSFEKKLKKK